MAGTSHLLHQYQQPLWGRMDPALRNCFIGAGALGLVALLILLLVPIPALKPVTVAEVPERIARLILEKPQERAAKSGSESRPAPRATEPEAPPQVAAPPEPAAPVTPPARRVEAPKVATDRGIEGRQRATRDVTQNIANVTGSLNRVLDNIATQVPASRSASVSPAGSTPGRGRRGVRAGRNSTQLATVGGVSGLSSADLSGSALEGKGVSIGMITDLGDGGGTRGQSGDDPGHAAGDRGTPAASDNNSRSNESLLAVVRRYAPGIQFCYDNELRKKPGLRGKLVVSMVVLANGSVSEATIVEDTLNSPAVRDCALAQIRTWQFPAIPSGVTSFKTPFVFTPPSQ
jgi:TonB family protein